MPPLPERDRRALAIADAGGRSSTSSRLQLVGSLVPAQLLGSGSVTGCLE
jgi:hypothetical protein